MRPSPRASRSRARPARAPDGGAPDRALPGPRSRTFREWRFALAYYALSLRIMRKMDFLRAADLTHAELSEVLDLAAAMKLAPNGWRRALPGETLALCFDKPSTRTRTSFAAAAWRLGMLPLELRPEDLQLGRGESLEDTARALSGYVSAIVVRTYAQRTLEALAAAASVPVVNALTDEHHPCQALADLLTLRERFGDLGGLRLAYVGDGNNVVHSLLEAGALAGVEIVVASQIGRASCRER